MADEIGKLREIGTSEPKKQEYVSPARVNADLGDRQARVDETEKKRDKVQIGAEEEDKDKKPGETKDTEKDKEIEELKKQIEELKKLLEELLNQKKAGEGEKGGAGGAHQPQQAGAPQGAGGAQQPQQAGAPQGAGGAQQPGMGGPDWDTKLMQDCMQVLREKMDGAGGAQNAAQLAGLQGQNLLGMGGPQAVPGTGGLTPTGLIGMPQQPGVPGVQPIGAGQQGGAVGQLIRDYQEAKQTGVQLQPQTELIVQSTLQLVGVDPQQVQQAQPFGGINGIQQQLGGLLGQLDQRVGG